MATVFLKPAQPIKARLLTSTRYMVETGLQCDALFCGCHRHFQTRANFQNPLAAREQPQNRLAGKGNETGAAALKMTTEATRTPIKVKPAFPDADKSLWTKQSQVRTEFNC
jgi:hypothetical protein